jgi:hypothetical protein
MRDLNEKMAQERTDYETKLKAARQKQVEESNKSMIMSNEVERINKLLNDKNKEVEFFKEKLQHQEKTKEKEFDRLKNEINTLRSNEEEVGEKSKRVDQDKHKLESKNRELKKNIIELENKIAYLSVETEKFKALYDDLKNDNKVWKDKCEQLEEANVKEIKILKEQNENISKTEKVRNGLLFNNRI